MMPVKLGKKTRKMVHFEEMFGEPIEKTIGRLYNEGGYALVCKTLSLSPSVVNYWMLLLGVRIKRTIVRR